MPLSEHEQRMLDEIERALYAEDPKFASVVRSSDLRSHQRRRIRRAAVLLVLGLVALVAGAVVQQIALGIAGFVAMLVAALVMMRGVQRLRGGETASAGQRPARRSRRRAERELGSETRGGLLGRIEDRWNRRREGYGE